MLSLIIKLAQVGIVVFWLAMILSVTSVVPPPYREPIVWIGTFVLLIHLSEYFFIRNRVSSRQGAGISFLGTMIFGFTYWLPLISEKERPRNGG